MTDIISPVLNKAHNSISLTAYQGAEVQQRGFDRALKASVENLDRSAIQASQGPAAKSAEIEVQREAAKAQRVARTGGSDAGDHSGKAGYDGSPALARGGHVDLDA